MIHIIDKKRTFGHDAAEIARAIAGKSHNTYYRGRLHVVAANEDGSYSVALDGTRGADHLYRNRSRVVGTYFVTRNAQELTDRLLEDIAATVKS